MRITVRYSARFQYAREASFSPHRVRLFPRHDLFINIERITFSTHASANVHYRHDLFDNLTATCAFPDSLDLLDFELEFDAVSPGMGSVSFSFRFPRLAICRSTIGRRRPRCWHPFGVRVSRRVALRGRWRRVRSGRRSTALVAMNSWLHENIGYERREEGDAFPPKAHSSGRQVPAGILPFCWQRFYARMAWPHDWRAVIYGRMNRRKRSRTRSKTRFTPGWRRILPGAGWIGLDPDQRNLLRASLSGDRRRP